MDCGKSHLYDGDLESSNLAGDPELATNNSNESHSTGIGAFKTFICKLADYFYM